jgi:hypothetical protein
MAANFQWTKSTALSVKTYEDPLKSFISGLRYLETPGPVLYVKIEDDNGNAELTNDDYGVKIDWAHDEENGDDFDFSEIEAYDLYMTAGTGRSDWRHLVDDDNELMKIPVESLLNLLHLSIDSGHMRSPLVDDILSRNKYRIHISGDSEDGYSPYVLDYDSFSNCVDESELYCIQSTSTPSSDTNLCYFNVYFYRGPRRIFEYEFDFSGIDFSQVDLKNLSYLVSKFFNRPPKPDELLEEFLQSGKCTVLEDFASQVQAFPHCGISKKKGNSP